MRPTELMNKITVRRAYDVSASSAGKVAVDGDDTDTPIVLDYNEGYAFHQLCGAVGTKAVLVGHVGDNGMIEAIPHHNASTSVTASTIPSWHAVDIRYHRRSEVDGLAAPTPVDLGDYITILSAGGKGSLVVVFPDEVAAASGEFVLYVNTTPASNAKRLTVGRPLVPRLRVGDYVWAELSVEQRVGSGTTWSNWALADGPGATRVCEGVELSVSMSDDTPAAITDMYRKEV